METLEKRIRRLEMLNRLLLCGVAVVLLAAWSQKGIADEVKARKFTLIDAFGNKEVGKFGTDMSGPVLEMGKNATGKIEIRAAGGITPRGMSSASIVGRVVSKDKASAFGVHISETSTVVNLHGETLANVQLWGGNQIRTITPTKDEKIVIEPSQTSRSHTLR